MMSELVCQEGRPAERPADQHETLLSAASRSPSLGQRGAMPAHRLFRKLALCGEDEAGAGRDEQEASRRAEGEDEEVSAPRGRLSAGMERGGISDMCQR